MLPIQRTKNGSCQSHSVAKISDAKSTQTRLGCERMREESSSQRPEYCYKERKREKKVKKGVTLWGKSCQFGDGAISDQKKSALFSLAGTTPHLGDTAKPLKTLGTRSRNSVGRFSISSSLWTVVILGICKWKLRRWHVTWHRSPVTHVVFPADSKNKLKFVLCTTTLMHSYQSPVNPPAMFIAIVSICIYPSRS